MEHISKKKSSRVVAGNELGALGDYASLDRAGDGGIRAAKDSKTATEQNSHKRSGEMGIFPKSGAKRDRRTLPEAGGACRAKISREWGGGDKTS